MKIAFAGTPEFARVALERLHAVHEVALVLTQPDRPAGRGLKPQASPVKAYAEEQGLRLAQPRGLRLDGKFAQDAQTARTLLQASLPEVIVVAAYGLILPAWTLELPARGCVNIHASLLPRWRGAAPIQRAIEAGDTSTGITIMQMDAGLDTGDMLLREALDISHDDTTNSLQQRLATLGAKLVVDTLELASRDALTPLAQPADGATYAAKIDKREASIDWRADAQQLERRIRAFDPFPGAAFDHAGQTIKCWRAEVVRGDGSPGELVAVDARGPVVACGVDALRLLALQRPGGKRLPAEHFLRTSAWKVGHRLLCAAD
jgi:methionyl-tRNA formyltransferase